MAKVILVDGKPHRMRRGKLVEILAEWVGRVPSQKRIRGRRSRLPKKLRKDEKWTSDTARHVRLRQLGRDDDGR